jgi:negative regulator of sigma E activity
MTEQINDQVSAFIDDELSVDESALLVRRFERDPDARARATRYTLIGSALRGELLEPHPSILRQRVAAALNGAAPVPSKRRPAALKVSRPLVGFGIAATVALVAIGSLRMLSDVAPNGGAPLAAGIATTAVVREEAAEAPSYVVPQDAAAPRVVTPPMRLTNYLMRHGVYASSLTRTTVNSNVVGITTGAAEEVDELPGAASAKPVPLDAGAPE